MRSCLPPPLVPRNDPLSALHQCRHGAVQERVHRDRKSAPTAGPPGVQKCVRAAASTTTSTMSAIPPATTPSSRCSAISPSATISRKKRSVSPGTTSPRIAAFPGDRLLITVYPTDDEARALWKKIAGVSDDRIIRIPTRTISGRWAAQVPAARARRSSTTRATGSPGGPPGSAGRRRRPFPRNLESGLHAVRAGR